MADVGIQRIQIVDTIDGAGGDRFIWAQAHQPFANALYRRIFEDLGSPLLPGYRRIECTKEEFEAGYDYALGIDVILTLGDGSEMTLQEKFLETDYCTVTVEYMQNPLTEEQGDWFNMRAQLYFVGYDREHRHWPLHERRHLGFPSYICPRCQDPFTFQDYILLNWPMTKMSQGIPWRLRHNRRDGARASFRFAKFIDFPEGCVIARNIGQWNTESLFGELEDPIPDVL